MATYPTRLLWSSEGLPALITSPALMAPQKTLSSSNNGGGAGSAAPVVLDVSPFRELLLLVSLLSFTGGTTPSFTPEWDTLDDLVNPGPDVLPLWKPTPITATPTRLLQALGAAPFTSPTVTGWTVGNIQFPFGTLGQFSWTVAGAPTAVAWTALIYGK